MLDSNIAPHQWIGTPLPTMIVQNAVKSTSPSSFNDDYWMCPEYYIAGQFLKFVKSGALRIKSNYGSKATVTNIAFKNPDGSIVVVVINQTNVQQPFKFLCKDMQVNAILPAGTVGIYICKN